MSGSTSLVLVEIGGNDVLRATRPLAFEEGLDVLLAKLRDTRRTVVMLELPLPPFHNRYGEVQRRLAKRHGVLLVPKRVLMGVLTSAGSATLDTVPPVSSRACTDGRDHVGLDRSGHCGPERLKDTQRKQLRCVSGWTNDCGRWVTRPTDLAAQGAAPFLDCTCRFRRVVE